MQTVKFARQRAVRLHGKDVLTYPVPVRRGDMDNRNHWVARAGVVVE